MPQLLACLLQVAATLQLNKSAADAKAFQRKDLDEEARVRYEAGQERIEARLPKLEALLQSSITHRLNRTPAKASPCDTKQWVACSIWPQS